MSTTLSDVVSVLQEQNSNLSDQKKILKSVESRLKNQAQRIKRQRQDDLEKEEEARRKKMTKPLPVKPAPSSTLIGGIKQGAYESSGLGFISDALGKLLPAFTGGIIGSLFGATALASVKGGIGKMIGRGLIFGGLAALVSTFSNDLIKDYIDQLDTGLDLELDEETKKGLSNTLSDSVTNSIIGYGLFGKKGAVAAFFGTMISDGIQKAFPEVGWEEKAKLFGLDLGFSNETFLNIGSMLGAFFGPGLIMGAISKAFTGSSDVEFDKKSGRYRNKNTGKFAMAPEKKSLFRGAFSKALNVGGIASSVGDALGSLFSNEFLGDDDSKKKGKGKTSFFTKNAKVASKFATLKNLVGLSLPLAIAGLAIGGITSLLDWMRGKNDQMRSESVAKAQNILNNMEGDDFSGLSEEQLKDLARAQYEGKRAADLAGGQTEAEKKVLEEIAKKKASTHTEEGKLSQSMIDKMLSEAIQEKDPQKLVSLAENILRDFDQEVTQENIENTIRNLLRSDAQRLQQKRELETSGRGDFYVSPKQTRDFGLEIFKLMENNNLPLSPLPKLSFQDIQQLTGESKGKGGSNIQIDASTQMTDASSKVVNMNQKETPMVTIDTAGGLWA